MAPVESTFMERTIPDTIVLFDVDGTLTPARNVSRLEMEMNVKWKESFSLFHKKWKIAWHNFARRWLLVL